MVDRYFEVKRGYSLREGGFTANSQLVDANNVNVTTQVNTAGLFASANVIVGANLLLNTSTIFIGNTTVNVVSNSSTIVLASVAATATINTTAFSGRAANSLALNGKADTYFTNADNLASGTVPSARLPASNTSQAGIVQLSDAINSTSITIAATANAAKQAYDKGAAALSAAQAIVPGGSNTSLAFNDSGSFGGGDGLRFVKTTNTIFIGNSVTNATINSTSFSGIAADASKLNTQAASYYLNATNLASGTVPSARLPASNTLQAGIVQLVDAINNTSITIAATANSVKTAYDKADAAYSLASGGGPGGSNTSLTFNDSGSFGGGDGLRFVKTTNTIFIGNSVTNATINSTSFSGQSADSVKLNGQAASFYTGKSDTAYSNAVTYTDTKAATAYSNATTFASNADNIASGTVAIARLPAASVSTAGVVQIVDSITNTSITIAAAANAVKRAYDGALTYASNADNISSGTVAIARLPSSNTSQKGVVQLVDAIDNTSITIAPTANSVKTAYDNATTFASNATNLSSGTVASARLPAANTSQAGIVRLVDTVTNTSITIAPTANALSWTYTTALLQAATAYTNAASYADTKAATAYSNAVAVSMPLAGTSANVSLASWTIASTGPGTTGVITAPSGTTISISGSIVTLNSLIVQSTASKPGGGSWADSSDEKQKQHIEDSDIGGSWHRINTLLPREFKWRQQKDRRPIKDIGFIAQEFEKVYPYSVTMREDGIKMIEMNFDIFSDMVNVLQDLNRRVNRIENHLNEDEVL